METPTPTPPHHFGPETQAAIFVRGLGGMKPTIPTTFEALEAKAKAVMSADAFAYVAGGAGRERTMAANRAAFDRVEIVPRMLAGVPEKRALSVEMFGQKAEAPLFVSPVGVLELVHPEADLAVARAAARLALPMMISCQSSFPIEEIAKANGAGPRWFQLYWGKSDAIAESLVRRAEACGCAAIVISLDTTLLGWRPRDLDLGYSPFLLGKGIAQYTSDPVFRASLAHTPEEDPRAAALAFTKDFSNPGLDWARIAKIRSWTRLPVVLKGIQRADNAVKAAAEGYDVLVSNHGGRQVDGAVGALDALSSIAPAVGEKGSLLFDSGVRGGADVFKALALGANVVGIARPYIYGLALDGEAGVQAVLEYLIAELDLTMALAGCPSVSAIGQDYLTPTPHSGR